MLNSFSNVYILSKNIFKHNLGYLPKSDDTGCVKCPEQTGFISSKLNADYECTCDDAFSILSPETELCSCSENYLFHDNSCKKCFGHFASLNTDGECSCVDGDMLRNTGMVKT